MRVLGSEASYLGKTRLFLVVLGRNEVLAFLGEFKGLWKIDCSLSSLVK